MTIGSVKRQGPFNFELQRNCDLRSGKIWFLSLNIENMKNDKKWNQNWFILKVKVD
jgi:hypothetical protein